MQAASAGSCAEPPDIVGEVADDESPPHDESDERGQDRAGTGMLVTGQLPVAPIGWQHREAERHEVLLELERSERPPEPAALEGQPGGDAVERVDVAAEQRGHDIE